MRAGVISAGKPAKRLSKLVLDCCLSKNHCTTAFERYPPNGREKDAYGSSSGAAMGESACVTPPPKQPDPLTADLRTAIAEAYPWLRALGNRTIESPYGRFVVDPKLPDVWVANHLQHPRAGTAAEVDALLFMMDEVFAHCSHRMVMTDGFTPDGFVARLLADGFRELDATIQMALVGELAEVAGPPLDFVAVGDEPTWAELYRLMRADHEEGRRTHGMVVPDEVT
jgi:hypothetical protein